MLIIEKNRKLVIYIGHKVSTFMMKNRVDNVYKKGKIKEKRNETMQKFIKKHKMGIIVTISVIIMVIGLSFAWLQLTLRGNKELSMMADGLKLVLDDTMEGGIHLVNAIPVTDEEGLTQVGYTFTLENTGKIDSSYEIYLDDLDLDERQTRMQDRFLKYQLVKDGEEISLDLLSTTGENPNRLLDKGEISSGEKFTYTLKLWIDYDATNEVMKTSFKGQLRVEAIQSQNKSLYKRIAKKAVLDNQASEFVSSTTGIDFSKVSSDTNGKGIYTFSSTKDDKYPVHYYRGAVTDNNVKFGGFCWKIVRTTETGGVKLIYNGSPDENGYCSKTTGEAVEIGTSAFNESYNSKEYVGYMINNTTDSTIKKVIDTWYQTNMTEFTEKLEDTVWCNDRSIAKTGNNNIYFSAWNRACTTFKPSLSCANDTDKFTVNKTNGNGILTYPVALLTSDEIILAGGKNGITSVSANPSYYLYTNKYWWSISPSYFYDGIVNGFDVDSDGGMSSGKFRVVFGVRPSISLTSNTSIKSGNGSMEKPFEIK